MRGRSGKFFITGAVQAFQNIFLKVLHQELNYHQRINYDASGPGWTEESHSGLGKFRLLNMERILAVSIERPEDCVRKVSEAKCMLFLFELRNSANQMVSFVDFLEVV